MNRQNESSAEATTENIENKLDPNTPEILESKREKNSKEHVSNPSRLDIEGYIFKDSKLIKKKKKVYTDVYGVDSDSIVVKSNTTNHYKKHRSKSHHHHSKHRKMKTWKKVLLSIGCILLGLIILTVGTVAYLIYQVETSCLIRIFMLPPRRALKPRKTVSMSYTTVKHISSMKR